MANPERPQQEDGYARGVDMVRLLSNEFGMSPATIRSQLIHSATQIEIDGVPTEFGDRLFLPYEMVKGKTITIIGPERHFQLEFSG